MHTCFIYGKRRNRLCRQRICMSMNVHIHTDIHALQIIQCWHVSTSAARETPSGTWWKYICSLADRSKVSNFLVRCILCHNRSSFECLVFLSVKVFTFIWFPKWAELKLSQLIEFDETSLISKLWYIQSLCVFRFANSRIKQPGDDSGVRPTECNAGRRTGLSRYSDLTSIFSIFSLFSSLFSRTEINSSVLKYNKTWAQKKQLRHTPLTVTEHPFLSVKLWLGCCC